MWKAGQAFMIPHWAVSCRAGNPDQKGGATRTVSGIGGVEKEYDFVD